VIFGPTPHKKGRENSEQLEMEGRGRHAQLSPRGPLPAILQPSLPLIPCGILYKYNPPVQRRAAAAGRDGEHLRLSVGYV
jgi:hypothetical protein